MPNRINLQSAAATAATNVGVGGRTLEFGLLRYVVAVPRGWSVAEADRETLFADLAEAAQKNPYTTRVYGIGPFHDITDNSGDPVTETTGYGTVYFIADGAYNFTLRLPQNKFLHSSLTQFNNSQERYDWLFGFDAGIAGTGRINPATGLEEFSGIRASSVYVPNMKVATATTKEVYNFNIVVQDSAQLNADVDFIEAVNGEGVTDIPGVIDVHLSGTYLSSPAGALDITPQIVGGGDYLRDIFEGTLANASAWIVANATTGNIITVTGVTRPTGAKTYRLQCDTTDTDYPLSGANLTVTMASVATLYPLGVEGYEAHNTLTLTRP